MVLYWPVVPNWTKKLITDCASALGLPLIPQVADGPQKIGTTLARWITGPLW